MRSLAFVTLLVACAPKVQPSTTAFDEDLGPAETTMSPEVTVEPDRPVAPPGKGLRTGTIERAKLVAVLDAGPPMFLRQLEVSAKMNGERFVGWQLVQLVDRAGPLVDVDVVPGDVLLAINGQPISRPDQLQRVWDSLRTANTVTAQMWRGDSKFDLAFTIEPQVAPAAAPNPPVQLK
jgi:type II secretory pathway component PulC